MSHDFPHNDSGKCERESNAIQSMFRRPFFLSLTIGIPFCVFKLLFGVMVIRTGAADNVFLIVTGWMVVFWAVSDLMMNTGRSILDLLHRPAPFEYCTIAQAGYFFRKPMLFLAIDTFLAFSIICFMLWSGWITRLSLLESYLWYSATTMNLISLSLAGIYHEIQSSR